MATMKSLMTASLCAVIAASTLAPASAKVMTDSYLSPSVNDVTQVAFNKIIRIGPRRNALRTWRCAVTIDGNRYYSTGVSETGARAQLAAITDQKFYCRRDRRGLFF